MAARLRQIEFERCERLTYALCPKAEDGDLPAVRALVAIMARRAGIVGLDARTQTSVTGDDGGLVTVIHQ